MTQLPRRKIFSKTIQRNSQKTKIEPLYVPAIPLLGIYSKDMKILTQKYIYTPMFIAALFIIVNIWERI